MFDRHFEAVNIFLTHGNVPNQPHHVELAANSWKFLVKMIIGDGNNVPIEVTLNWTRGSRNSVALDAVRTAYTSGSGRPCLYRLHVSVTTSAIISRKTGSSLTVAARARGKPIAPQTSAASRSRSYSTSM